MKKGFWYRFFVLLLVYALFASIVLATLAEWLSLGTTGLFVLIAILVGLFALIEVANELLIRFRQKKTANNEHNRSSKS